MEDNKLQIIKNDDVKKVAANKNRGVLAGIGAGLLLTSLAYKLIVKPKLVSKFGIQQIAVKKSKKR